jgi:hypothetical protein
MLSFIVMEMQAGRLRYNKRLIQKGRLEACTTLG